MTIKCTEMDFTSGLGLNYFPNVCLCRLIDACIKCHFTIGRRTISNNEAARMFQFPRVEKKEAFNVKLELETLYELVDGAWTR